MTDLDREWLDLAFKLAGEISDGHFTLLKFTTNYRAGFSTPANRSDIEGLAEGKSVAEAVKEAIKTKFQG